LKKGKQQGHEDSLAAEVKSLEDFVSSPPWRGSRRCSSRLAKRPPDWLAPLCYLRSMCFTGISRRPNISTAAWDCSKIT